MENLLIIKIGGNLIDDEQSLAAFLNDFAQINDRKILIHGGGKQATEISKALGITTQMVNGRRITSRETLDVVTMVYAGLINKTIVSGLQARNCNALGLTGADANLIRARKRQHPEIDFGFVGDVAHINTAPLINLINAGICPILAALTHDGKGNMLNTNADTIAAEVAKALRNHFQINLLYCFDKKGVLASADENSVISVLTFAHYQSLRASGVIAQGMLPKLDNAFAALQAGVDSITICHASEFLFALRDDENCGTQLHA